MQVIIDIPDRSYERLQRVAKTKRNMEHLSIYGELILNGKPLPKGHGRLIILSEDAVKREQTFLRFSCQDWISEVGLSNATVEIIEVDKAENEVDDICLKI